MSRGIVPRGDPEAASRLTEALGLAGDRGHLRSSRRLVELLDEQLNRSGSPEPDVHSEPLVVDIRHEDVAEEDQAGHRYAVDH